MGTSVAFLVMIFSDRESQMEKGTIKGPFFHFLRWGRVLKMGLFCFSGEKFVLFEGPRRGIPSTFLWGFDGHSSRHHFKSYDRSSICYDVQLLVRQELFDAIVNFVHDKIYREQHPCICFFLSHNWVIVLGWEGQILSCLLSLGK